MGDVDAVPNESEREHEDSESCWCNPDVVFETEAGCKVTVHKGPGDELAPAWIIAQAIADAIADCDCDD